MKRVAVIEMRVEISFTLCVCRTLMPLYDSDTGMLFIAGKVCFAFTHAACDDHKAALVDIK